MPTELITTPPPPRVALNKGRIVGQKRPLQPKHVWSIRIRLEISYDLRDLALFNMAIDSKLGGPLRRWRVSVLPSAPLPVPGWGVHAGWWN